MNSYKIPLHIDFKSLRNIDLDEWYEIKQTPVQYLHKYNLKVGDILLIWEKIVIQIIPYTMYKNNNIFFCSTWNLQPHLKENWKALRIKTDNLYYYYKECTANIKTWSDPDWRRKIEMEVFF